MRLIHWIFGSFLARRRARAGHYDLEVLCAGWVELPAGFRASTPGRHLPGSRGPTGPTLPS